MLNIDSANSFIHFLDSEHETKLPQVDLVLLKGSRHHCEEWVFLTKKLHGSDSKEAYHHGNADDANSGSKSSLVLATLLKC